MNVIIDKINKEQLKEQAPEFAIGDTVKVHVAIREGDKERVQMFTGTVIARSGHDINETFTVRRMAYGLGVERVFPVHSPRIVDVEVIRRGDVSRAKLYYLRDRQGKDARVREKLRGAK
ncbi:MAG TPA: 50S ribosomal protein L19 [Lentisphaeria bacterium]|nr:50S ribosomal protein L19 [Lentisphaeria bacterium]|tara:strand:+ start:1167 stop:1523 length:357 start_codon:yes stop_codon:yes gene_type:complete